MISGSIISHWTMSWETRKFYLMTTACWKFGGDEVPDGYEGLSERLNFEVKGERWDLVPGEEIKFNDGWGKFVTFSRPW